MAWLVGGLVQGGIYGLFALSLALLFSVMRVVNFAHGDFLTLGLYGVLLLGGRHMPLYVTGLIIAGAFALLGGILYLSVFRFTFKSKQRGLSQVFVTVAMSIVLENALLLGFGGNNRTFTGGLNGVITVGTVIVPWQRLLPGLVLVGLLGVTGLLLRKTPLGLQIRAVAEDSTSAVLAGVNITRVYVIISAYAFALLGIAATTLAPVLVIYPTSGFNLLLAAILAVVIGGMGSWAGAAVGGILLGLVESLFSFYIGPLWGPVGMYTVFIAVLAVRPRGLFGDPTWQLE